MTTIHPILIMLLEANAVLASFVLIYIIFFKKLTHFSLNRYLLLAAVATSVLVGSINYQHIETVYVAIQTPEKTEVLEEPVLDTIAQSNIKAKDTIDQSFADKAQNLLLLVLALGAVFQLGKFTIGILSLRSQIKQTQHLRDNLYVGENISSAFSFMNRVFLPRSYATYNSKKLDVVIAHEQRHLDLKHSFDMLFLAIAKALFWYNPLFTFLQNELKTVHEFQADEWVQTDISVNDYSELLMDLTMKNPVQNPFYQSFSMFGLKRRIGVMQLENSSRIQKLKYLLFIPLVASLGYAFSFQKTTEYQFTQDPGMPVSHEKMQLPIAMDEITRVSPFGYRVHPFNAKRKMHRGIDLVAPQGTDVFAAQAGKVFAVENNTTGYGIKIVIDHGDSLSTSYSHLQKALVKIGQDVKRGALIAYCGTTGQSTGPHLHFEVLKGEAVQNPQTYFSEDLSSFIKESDSKTSQLTVILDAGHGGKDPGNSTESNVEKDINLKAVLMLKEKLEAKNMKVILTRSSDQYLSLEDRSNYTVNQANAIFVSVHTNAAEKTTLSGIELFVPEGNGERSVSSQKLASMTKIELTDSKVSVRDIKQANYFVLKESHVPALLLELGFMTNAEDLEKMNSPEYLEQICEALTKSILLYSK